MFHTEGNGRAAVELVPVNAHRGTSMETRQVSGGNGLADPKRRVHHDAPLIDGNARHRNITVKRGPMFHPFRIDPVKPIFRHDVQKRFTSILATKARERITAHKSGETLQIPLINPTFEDGGGCRR